MLLDALKNYFWQNEPANVRFVENGMMISTESETDFWQSIHHNIHKDNGHFFYTEKKSDFTMLTKWHFKDSVASDQCGLMIRVDSLNWAKISFLTTDLQKPQIGSVVSVAGTSDWSIWPLQEIPSNIWFKVSRKGKDFSFSFSIDGFNFIQTRVFSIPLASDKIKSGAYACSPQKHSFECILEEIF